MSGEPLPEPAPLLKDHFGYLTGLSGDNPVLDMACGDGHNGIFLAGQGLSVVLCDTSTKALESAALLAENSGVKVRLWQVDLEKGKVNPLPEDHYGAILIFRYLHRPLIPCIKKALIAGGILIYETFTVDQPRFGKPRNPDYLLKHGELKTFFPDWDIIHYFEGLKPNPDRAVAQIVSRKPCQKRITTHTKPLESPAPVRTISKT